MILIHCPLTAGTQFTDSGDKVKTTFDQGGIMV